MLCPKTLRRTLPGVVGTLRVSLSLHHSDAVSVPSLSLEGHRHVRFAAHPKLTSSTEIPFPDEVT